MHPPVSLMSSNVFWRPSSAAGQRCVCVHRIAHLLSQSAVVPFWLLPISPRRYCESSHLLLVFFPLPLPLPLQFSARWRGENSSSSSSHRGLCAPHSLSSSFLAFHIYPDIVLDDDDKRQGPSCDLGHTWFRWSVSFLCFDKFMLLRVISNYRYATL